MTKKAARGSQSQAIRDFLKAHKNAEGPDVVEALAKKGIKVSLSMVYDLMARTRMNKRRRKAQASGTTEIVSLPDLIAAMKLIDEVGGVEQALGAVLGYEEIVLRSVSPCGCQGSVHHAAK